MSVTLAGIEDSFDNEAAEKILSLSVDKLTYTSSLLRKSLYDFDLDTPEGIEKLMALLPIMDPEIIKDIMAELWSGYSSEEDARRHRLEIKGYLKDYLEALDDPEAAEEQQLLAQSPAQFTTGEQPAESTTPDADGSVANEAEAAATEEQAAVDEAPVAETPAT